MRPLLSSMSSRCLPVLLGLALTVPMPFALAAVEGSSYEACPSCVPGDLAWNDGEFDQIYLSTGNAPANLQPHVLAVDSVSRALALLKVEGKNKPVAVFGDDSARNLARGLAAALAKAGPQQDVLFFIVSSGNSGLFGSKLGNSGRAFIDQHGLNIIFGEARVDFIGRYRATRMRRAFDFGSRTAASPVRLAADGMHHVRSDWVVVPLMTPVQTGTPAVLMAPALPVQMMAAPVVQDDKYYAAQEERLKSLKRLRAQDLITEQEYQAKRADILKAW
ncbi:hypothetical protein QN362_17820 [Actimicrobium sp. CCC2.4]|uniref:SHOCT domain-containing protein n=1 Tax=Actimicrobium sp. CCC2.4 TaxID=3048606 RepID=UPI002AC9536D|nr:hypothetical protein [Actimicrobium sp. CCC2.4]MEB0137194.1 hypothetical protein [Actimicrobium sp. CCC2.4]WPX32491.1 hypothetical protein RHM62_01185 [Actimicrobium sp. CCC2.4]